MLFTITNRMIYFNVGLVESERKIHDSPAVAMAMSTINLLIVSDEVLQSVIERNTADKAL